MIRPSPRSTLFPYTTLFRSISRFDHPSSRRRDCGGGMREFLAQFRHAPSQVTNALARLRARILDGRLRRERSEEHTSELQSQANLVCRLLPEKQKETGTAPY